MKDQDSTEKLLESSIQNAEQLFLSDELTETEKLLLFSGLEQLLKELEIHNQK